MTLLGLSSALMLSIASTNHIVIPAVPSAWAAPSTGASSGVFGALQLETGLDVPLTPAQSSVWPRFSVERAELGGGVMWQRTAAVLVRLEAIRSASPQSAFGIDRNSLLPRFRLAYASWTPRTQLLGVELEATVRAGLIPEPWLERLENVASTRGLSALASERTGAMTTSDLGVSAGMDVAHGLLDVTLSIVNGEGKLEVEQNPGKNTQVLVSLRPLSFDLLGSSLAVRLHAGLRDGSVGVSSARDQRALGAVTLSHGLFRLGAESVYALGLGGRADREVLIAGGWGDAHIIPGWVSALVRGEFSRDLQSGSDGANTTEVLAGLYSDFGTLGARRTELGGVGRMRLYIAGAARQASAAAATAGSVDASTAWRIVAMLEMTQASDVMALGHTAEQHNSGGLP